MSRAASYPLLLLGILGRGLFRERHHDGQDTVGTGLTRSIGRIGASSAIRISLAAYGAKLLLHPHPRSSVTEEARAAALAASPSECRPTRSVR